MEQERIYTPNPVMVALLVVCISGGFFALGYILMDWLRESKQEEQIEQTLRRWAQEAKAKTAQELRETPPPPPTLAPEVE